MINAICVKENQKKEPNHEDGKKMEGACTFH